MGLHSYEVKCYNVTEKTAVVVKAADSTRVRTCTVFSTVFYLNSIASDVLLYDVYDSSTRCRLQQHTYVVHC